MVNLLSHTDSIMGIVIGALLTGYSNHALGQRKLRSRRILKAIDTRDQTDAVSLAENNPEIKNFNRLMELLLLECLGKSSAYLVRQEEPEKE